jgi:hypothetical protein
VGAENRSDECFNLVRQVHTERFPKPPAGVAMKTLLFDLGRASVNKTEVRTPLDLDLYVNLKRNRRPTHIEKLTWNTVALFLRR